MSLYDPKAHKLTAKEATAFYMYLVEVGQLAPEFDPYTSAGNKQAERALYLQSAVMYVENKLRDIAEDISYDKASTFVDLLPYGRYRPAWELYLYTGKNRKTIYLTPLFFDVLEAHMHLVATNEMEAPDDPRPSDN